jgi:hypothetical protein
MTAAACSQSECEGCEIQGKLLCVHKPKDLIDFYVLFMGWAIPFFVISEQWLLLTLTSSAMFVAGWTLQRTQCNRCYNLSCPINRVPDDVRDSFFRKYPEFVSAWGKINPDRS